MEAMLAMADLGKWILLVVTSAFPLLMMVLARLSLVSATSKYDGINTTCGNNDTAAAATAAALNSVESSGESVQFLMHIVMFSPLLFAFSHLYYNVIHNSCICHRLTCLLCGNGYQLYIC